MQTMGCSDAAFFPKPNIAVVTAFPRPRPAPEEVAVFALACGFYSDDDEMKMIKNEW